MLSFNPIGVHPEVAASLLGDAILFTKLLFAIFVPLNPPPLPTSKVMDFLLNFY